MKIGVLGPRGMLGHMVVKQLSPTFEVLEFGRKDVSIGENTSDVVLQLHKLPKVDYLINCIGSIKPRFKSANSLPTNIVVNSIFPHILADHCLASDTKLIHITTDCVFDGATGQYTETSLHNATDEYGKSKSLGESTKCMTIRTSIIGPECDGTKSSLVEWLLSQNNKSVNGFTNHLWNGLTTLELAKCIKKIINRNYYAPGIYHVFGEDITKHHMLDKMVELWELNIEVKPVVDKNYCNRTLRTNLALNGALSPAKFSQMITELDPHINV